MAVTARMHLAATRILEREKASRHLVMSEPRTWLERALAGELVPVELARTRLARIDDYLRVAPGWAQGVEMETSELERALVCATIAIIENDEDALVTACITHAAFTAQIVAHIMRQPLLEAHDRAAIEEKLTLSKV